MRTDWQTDGRTHRQSSFTSSSAVVHPRLKIPSRIRRFVNAQPSAVSTTIAKCSNTFTQHLQYLSSMVHLACDWANCVCVWVCVCVWGVCVCVQCWFKWTISIFLTGLLRKLHYLISMVPEISYENVTSSLQCKSGEREYFQANNWTGESPSG